MKIILQKDIINLGDSGDVCEVADGYARNYLLPEHLAIRATKGSTKAAVHQKKISKLKKDKRKKIMEDVAKKLEDKTIEIKAKLGTKGKLFGSITSAEIANELKKFDVELDKRKIEISNPIKSLGKYDIKIKLAEGLHKIVKLNVIQEEV